MKYFGEMNFVSEILYRRGGFQTSETIANTFDYILWYAKDISTVKVRPLFMQIEPDNWYSTGDHWIERLGENSVRRKKGDVVPPGYHLHSDRACFSATGTEGSSFQATISGKAFSPPIGRGWSTSPTGVDRLIKANRLMVKGSRPRFKPYYDDFPVRRITNGWLDTVRGGFTGGGPDQKIYVVQTSTKIIERCMLMTSDPGDLVIDPTCGSGTTAYVAEQWGRRWITIDTSRVALALARARIIGARYPYYLLADSYEGRDKEAEITRSTPPSTSASGDVRQGFTYGRVRHITLRDIANNAEIDVIWERYQTPMEAVREQLNRETDNDWEEWEIPREVEDGWSNSAKRAHENWWELRIERQKEIDKSIADKSEFEYLYDKPYEDGSKVRVAGPFTVESVSPHRMMSVDENGEFFDGLGDDGEPFDSVDDFAQRMLEHLKTSGVQQAHKEDKIDFDSVVGFPGDYICAEGQYMEGDEDDGVRRRAGIYIGPEFGTVSRPDLIDAAREAAEIGFDVLIACAFNYEGHTAELERLGRIPVLKARMNADLHMSTDLKNTGKGNLFVIFGEPDVDVRRNEDDEVVVEVKGIDIFDPRTSEVRSDDTDGIACWFVDTDYNGESFFVRQAYFLGAQDPYKALKTTLKAEIDADAWATLNSAVSRPFDAPSSGRIAVKIINHLGDEAMKVFRVD